MKTERYKRYPEIIERYKYGYFCGYVAGMTYYYVKADYRQARFLYNTFLRTSAAIDNHATLKG